jgi:hypothetical protein
MSVTKKSVYVCDSCGEEACQEASDNLPSGWLFLNVQRTISYGGDFLGDRPLREASALRAIGDYCSSECFKQALQEGIEAVSQSVEDEISKINSSKSSQNVNNIGDGS